MVVRIRWVAVGAVLMLAALTGCWGKSEVKGRPKVYPVSGRITYKGEPVVGADVTFVCEEKERSAFGRTDSQGRFKLTTFSPNDGAVEGKHLVTVVKVDHGEAPPQPPVDDPAYDPEAVNRAAAAPPPKSLVPVKYGNPKTTDLFVVVTAGDNPEVTLELTD
jgi:hypothetical protein